MMPCHSSTSRNRSAWTRASIAKGMPTYLIGWDDTCPDSSPINLSRAIPRKVTDVGGIDVSNDIYHYVRIAESVIAERVDRRGHRARDVVRGRADDIEGRLVAKFVADAERIGTSYGDLVEWLENSHHRRRGVVDHKRGRERIPSVIQ